LIGEVVPAREGLRPLFLKRASFFSKIGEVVPAREGLRLPYPSIVDSLTSIGEVVPAREGLRHEFTKRMGQTINIGEVVPAREGLRLRGDIFPRKSCHRRSGSSKRRIKTRLSIILSFFSY